MKQLNFLTSGTLCSSQVFYYKTIDAKAIFAFSYEYQMGHYEIVIHEHPSYGHRNSGSVIAHWLPCDDSPINKKVCFTVGKEPNTLEKAKNISKQFAELTWNYIQTGITIDEQILRRN